MESSSNATPEQAASNPQFPRVRYRMRNRHQIQATRSPIDDSQQGLDRIFSPAFRIDGNASASRIAESDRPVSPSGDDAVEAWLHRRPAPEFGTRFEDNVDDVMEDVVEEVVEVEQPVEQRTSHRSAPSGTGRSMRYSIGRSKSVRDLLSSAASFARREKPAGDGRDSQTTTSAQPSTKTSRNSGSFAKRLKLSVGRAGGLFFQSLRREKEPEIKEPKGKERAVEPEESTSQITARHYDDWQEYHDTYFDKTAFKIAFEDETESRLDETVANIRQLKIERPSIPPAPRVPKRTWSARGSESSESESRHDSISPRASKASQSSRKYHTVR